MAGSACPTMPPNAPSGLSPWAAATGPFAGSDAGGRRAAAMYTLIETAKLNGIDPRAWLADVLSRLQDHPARQIANLLPWAWSPQIAAQMAA
jgi:transposase